MNSPLEFSPNRAGWIQPNDDRKQPFVAGGADHEEPCVVAGPSMRKIHDQIQKIASTTVPVLILGESGSGKEVLARKIHRLSARSNRPFLKVNCAALPSELLESELFGYEAGAFTGATRSKPGQFELCDHGTLLLDEIAEMPNSLQAKLLHVLQDSQFFRLGGRSLIKLDVRVLAATNVDIFEAMAAKRFREDLYYRLSVFMIRVPPLRERREEIPALLEHFVHEFSRDYDFEPLPITPALLDGCLRYSWPGNLRELENFVKRYLIIRDARGVLKQLQESIASSPSAEAVPTTTSVKGLKPLVKMAKRETEKAAIAEALETTGYNRKAAARILGISYKALRYKVQEYGLLRPSVRSLRDSEQDIPIPA